MTNLLLVMIGYLVGSVPSAYLLLKFFKGKDIRNEGTGNVGAANALDVSGSKLLSVSALIADASKAMLGISFVALCISSASFSIFLVGISIVVAHNWNVFLKFRGGRGLAPSLGIAFCLNAMPAIAWGLAWVILIKSVRNIHIRNCMASSFCIIVMHILPIELLSCFNLFIDIEIGHLRLLFTVINMLIIVSHWKPLKLSLQNFIGKS